MIRKVLSLGAALLAFAALPAHAELRILATTADWGALATELGGDQVNVYTATSALLDVHQVNAKPSLVARARTADLVVANGADLEIGWLPVLISESGNPKVRPGSPGYFEATKYVKLLDIPTSVDRSMGDVHPLGNPHIQLDPRNVAAVGMANHVNPILILVPCHRVIGANGSLTGYAAGIEAKKYLLQREKEHTA